MTERTTDREAQREAPAEAARSVAQRALQAQGDIASMYDEEIAGLRADVTRLEGERDALRAALLWAQVAIDRWIPNPSEFDESELALIADGRAGIRAALEAK